MSAPREPLSPRKDTLLFAEFPELERSLPWMPLAHVPTPLEPCTAIAPYLGRDGVWVKRDDLVSPVFGGNKVRRFEFLLAEAAARGAKELVTVGGLASTQVMATAFFGRALGHSVIPILFDQPVTEFVRYALRTILAAGADPVYGGGYLRTAWRTIRALRAAERPYFVFPGASNAVANLGYVDALLELAAQVDAGEMPRPDLIVVPTGSGGTLAGLALGAAMLGWSTEVIGVRITELAACNRLTIRFLIESTARLLHRVAPRFSRRRIGRVRFGLFHRAIGGGYGHPTRAAIEAIPEVMRLTGTKGEVTYSGKALVGLRAIARANPSKTILYWHTLPRTYEFDRETPSVPAPFARFFEGDALA